MLRTEKRRRIIYLIRPRDLKFQLYLKAGPHQTNSEHSILKAGPHQTNSEHSILKAGPHYTNSEHSIMKALRYCQEGT